MTGKRSREGRDVEEQSRATALRQRTRSNVPALPVTPATPPIAPTAPAPPPTAPAATAAAAQTVDAPAAPVAAPTASSYFARLTGRVSAALDRIPTGTACTGVVNLMVHVAGLSSTQPYVRLTLLAGNYLFVSLQIAKEFIKRRQSRRARATRR
eukprot:TRINITY_DN3829_c0_g1_i11.p1 TRINITY_DN3829_c0_g1~~TRINITY_DN3829_c0_g1_i11.p1  ORF type:complete len:154 (-),score=44.36 TRINITY_DN3829_c0_g1_i11:85-546(-)